MITLEYVVHALFVAALIVAAQLVSQVLTDWLWRKRYWSDLADHATTLRAGLFRARGEAERRGDTRTVKTLTAVINEAGEHPIYRRTRWPWSKR